MNRNDQTLAHRIKIKFGTAPNEPSDFQLSQIKAALKDILNNGKTPSKSDWDLIVKKYCPGAGKYFYGGADTSDLVALLQLATKTDSGQP